MQIRKITHKTLDDFPELKEQGYTTHDMYLVWKSYQNDIDENLLYPNNPYVKFFNLGLFYLTHEKLMYRKTSIIDNTSMPASIIKIDSLINICNRFIEFYNTLIIYLEGYSEKAEKDINEYNKLIKRIELSIEELKKYKYEHHERLTPRDLEKQITDSRGNQEQDIQEGAY